MDYTAAFRFNNPGDLDAGANPLNFIVDRYDGTWHTTNTGVRTSTSTQVTLLHDFGAFAAGEKFLIPTTTALTSDVNPSTCGQKVTLTATVTPTGATGTVTFFDGASTLGTGTLDANGNATLSVTNFTAGSHSLTASYASDGTYASSTSPDYTQTVNTTATTTALSNAPNPSTCGQ